MKINNNNSVGSRTTLSNVFRQGQKQTLGVEHMKPLHWNGKLLKSNFKKKLRAGKFTANLATFLIFLSGMSEIRDRAQAAPVKSR